MDRDVMVRWCAVWALDELPESDEVAHLLLGCLDDPSFRVRVAAARALCDFEQTVVAAGLIAHVHDSTPWVRAAVIAALGGRSPEAVVPVLLHALEDPQTRIREAAAKALGETVQEPALTERFTALLRRPHAGDRVVGVRALPLRHRPELCELTTRHLDDEVSRVRDEALNVLLEQRHPAAEARLREELHHRTMVKRRRALGRLAMSEERDTVDCQLLSCDLDGFPPFRDPWWPVTTAQVRLAAWRLGLPVDEVRERYEGLSKAYSLPLAGQS
jgi:HEAT repeat protein